jgi:hypothetical protein
MVDSLVFPIELGDLSPTARWTTTIRAPLSQSGADALNEICAKGIVTVSYLPSYGAITTAARTPLGGGAEPDHLTVFDDFISTSDVVHTSDDFIEWLGDHDNLGIHCVVDRQSGAGTITVHIEHANDTNHWLPKYPSKAEISAAPIPDVGQTANLAGFDVGDRVSFCYVRLAITLTGCTARVKIMVTRRRLPRR